MNCDCRLSWIQLLRNETKSEPLRMALDEVTCFQNHGKPEAKNDFNEDLVKEVKSMKSENLFEIESNSDISQQDENDEELYVDPNPSYKSETTIKPITNEIALVDIPTESLLCPSELIQNGEDSLMLSSKDENYWQPNSSLKILSNLFLVLTLVIISIVN